MKNIIIVLVSLFFVLGNINAKAGDPCKTLKVYVKKISKQLPVNAGDISTFNSIYIEGDYVVEMNTYHKYLLFTDGYEHPERYKMSLLKNWSNNKLLRKQAKIFLACGKQLKSVVKNDINDLTFEIIFTTEDLEKIANGK